MNLWGNISGSQAIELGMNIFNMAQQQAQQQQAIEREQKQLTLENMFKKQQLDIQQQTVDLNTQKAEYAREVDLQNIQTAKDRSEYYKAQRDEALETRQKLGEYSMKLGEMLETLDFSSPNDMKKLYAFQTQYTPYGVNAQYIKPVVAGGGMAQDEYGKFVKDLFIKVANTNQNEYNKEHQQYLKNLKDWEASGVFGFGRGEKPKAPEFRLPDVDQIKKIADQMLQRGIKIEDLVKPKPRKDEEKKPEETMPSPKTGKMVAPAVGKTLASGGLYPLYKITEKGGKTAIPVAKDIYKNITNFFNPYQQGYNNLSPADKRAVDIWMESSGGTMEEALNMLEENKRMKAQ